MKAYYRLLGLEQKDTVNIIQKEISAIHGVEEVCIDIQKQEMAICTDEKKLPRIEYAAMVIISYITPQINMTRI